ncbi:hypothetical protein [Natrarchaeobaculum sulfurireducens]|uniref:hypothetical protein n=1 Tax=Natrarchaeobaculum sulfurireducens TaxID=2044521 RepID=UPI00105AB0CD|nr:hypothetical protein [Natrarchaeobaculum sulfurireducens]
MIEGIPSWAWPVVGTLTGALIGAVVPYYLRNRLRKRKLRIALHTEIQSMEWQIRDWGKAVFATNPHHSGAPIPGANPFVSTVYETNAGEIGLLTDEEAEKVGELYSLIIWYNGIIERFLDREELPAHVTLVMLMKIPLLINMVNLALDSLEDNIPNQERENRTYPEFESQEEIENAVRRFDLDGSCLVKTES